jgi:hypothetical protein
MIRILNKYLISDPDPIPKIIDSSGSQTPVLTLHYHYHEVGTCTCGSYRSNNEVGSNYISMNQFTGLVVFYFYDLLTYKPVLYGSSSSSNSK